MQLAPFDVTPRDRSQIKPPSSYNLCYKILLFNSQLLTLSQPRTFRDCQIHAATKHSRSANTNLTMSRFFPHTPYAEDQPLSKTILTTHVLTRAFQAGSLVGSGVGLSLVTLRRFNILSPRIPPIPGYFTILRSTGIGAIVALGMLSIALPIRMWGREQIEWQDRSWRLRANKGQTECDDWTYGGMAAATAAVAWKGKGLGWRGAVGGVGIGSVFGMFGYMAYRNGLKGGKFEEDAKP